MEILITHLLGQLPLAALVMLTFVGFASSLYGRLWQNDTDRKRVMGRLATHGWRLTYTRHMRPVLDAVDNTLSKDELARGLPPARVAWSHDLIGWCMLLAAAYPALSITGHWLAGGPLQLAGQEIAPAGTAQARAYVAAWLGGPLVIFVVILLKSRWRLAFGMLSTGILLGGVFLAEQNGVPRSVAFAFDVAFVVAFAVAGASAFTVAGGGAVAGAVAVVGAFAGAAVGAFAVAVALDVLQDKKGRHATYWLGYIALTLLAVTTAILVSPAAQDGSIVREATYIVLFLGIFPLFNALADFASVGLTRYLLREGLEQTTWRKALVDLAGGALIFAGLAIILITYAHLVRFPDGTVLIDLTALFEGLRNSPNDYWWLFFMLFSTLIPTLLHGMVGIYTLLLHYPEPMRRWVFTRFERGGNGSETAGWWGSMGYCAMLTLSIWVPLLVTWTLLTANHSAFLQGVVWMFRQYALWIGAI